MAQSHRPIAEMRPGLAEPVVQIVESLLMVDPAKRMASTVAVTTDDGSTGTRGRVTDVLPEVMARAGTEVLYACGPMAMLRAVTECNAALDVVRRSGQYSRLDGRCPAATCSRN